MKRNERHALLQVAICLLLVRCGTSTGNPPSQLSGRAMLGPISQATVTAYLIQSDGRRGGVMGTAQTDASGRFTLSIPATATPVELVVANGQYTDEHTHQLVVLNREVRSRIPYVRHSRTVGIDSLTEVAASRAIGYAVKRANSGVVPATDSAAALAQLAADTEEASAEVGELFGLGAVDVTDVSSANPSEGTSGQSAPSLKARVVEEALSARANVLGTSVANLLDALDTAAASGAFSVNGAQFIKNDGTQGTLPATFLNDLASDESAAATADGTTYIGMGPPQANPTTVDPSTVPDAL